MNINEPQANVNLGPQYAGFWIRTLAIIIDTIILGLGNGVIAILAGISLATQPDVVAKPILSMFDLLSMLVGIVYYVGFNCSKYMGTPGKIILGIAIINEDGSPISIPKAIGRYFAQILSGLILLIGYIMAAFHPQKRALHDLICGTFVVYKRR